MQHLDVLNLRERVDESKKEPTDEGKGRAEDDAESTEEVETVRKAGTSGKRGSVNKD